MSIQSPCSIVFTPTDGEPVTLVAESDWLASLPRFEVSQDLFELDGVASGEAYFKALGGAVVSIQFTAEENPANPHDAFLEAAMIGAVNLLNIEGELVISSGEESASYKPAVIGSISPGLPVGPDAQLTREFAITSALPWADFSGGEGGPAPELWAFKVEFGAPAANTTQFPAEAYFYEAAMPEDEALQLFLLTNGVNGNPVVPAECQWFSATLPGGLFYVAWAPGNCVGMFFAGGTQINGNINQIRTPWEPNTLLNFTEPEGSNLGLGLESPEMRIVEFRV